MDNCLHVCKWESLKFECNHFALICTDTHFARLVIFCLFTEDQESDVFLSPIIEP